MNFAYLTESDVKTMLGFNHLKTPYVLVEASENT